MASTTLANQSSTLSITQRLSISIEVEQTIEIEGAAGFTNDQLINAINNSNASLDISSIILQVLGQFNSASLGNTDISGNMTISGDAVINNVDSQTINTGVIAVGDELIIGESSSFNLITRIDNFETTITTFNNRIENMENNIYVNDVSQTFFQIRTQQPHRFSRTSNEPYRTSSNIRINWNFDNIMAKFNNLPQDFILNNLNNNNLKDAQLPYINYIVLEISGNYLNFMGDMQSGWLHLHTINIPNNISYNSNSYKEFTINKTGYLDICANINNILMNSNDSRRFDIKVYGLNNGVDFPTIDNRALIFENLVFDFPRVPSEPIIDIQDQLSFTSLRLFFLVNFTEIDLSDSNALINKMEISYNLLDTFKSNHYSSTYTYNSLIDITEYSNPLYQKNETFPGILENLMPGSKYNFQARVQNNLLDNSFSEYSSLGETNYTLLPGSSNINTTIDFEINGNKEYITNQTFDNNEIIYININSNHNLSYRTSTQHIEITNPDASTNGIQNKGFGRLIDGSNDLVIINVYLDDISKQTIRFHGNFDNNDTTSITNLNITNFINPIGLINDIYPRVNSNTININEGYRLKAQLYLNNIINSDIISKIGNASPQPYNLHYEYIRNPSVNGLSQNNSYNIYVDNLTNDPSINYTINDTSCGVIDVLCNMGIPSVKTFSMSFIRTYTNINSSNLFIRGDKKLASISGITSTSANSEQIITLNSGQNITSSGMYVSNNNTSMITLNSNYYNSINYVTSRLTNNIDLTWSETVFNLFRPNGITNNRNFNTNHYCDYNSFNIVNNMINSQKLNLSHIYLYELANLTALGNNLSNLTFNRYNNHTQQVADHTLLYIDGKFQSNSSLNYPNISDYSYNSYNISNNYSNGNISYDLSGNETNLNNSGYKFIAFEIKKAPTNSNFSYIFNNTGYNQVFFDNKYYISINFMLSSFFDSNTINNIFNINNNDAIAFCKVSLNNNNFVRIGNLKQEYSPIGGNWLVNSNPSVNYNNTLQFDYGCKVENSNQDVGIYIDPTAVNDDLMLIIGLKNN